MTVDKDRQTGSTQPERDIKPDGEGARRINMHGDVAAGGFQSVIAAGARELEHERGVRRAAGGYGVHCDSDLHRVGELEGAAGRWRATG